MMGPAFNISPTPFRPKMVIDQAALSKLPVAPSDKTPFLAALAHVGRSMFGENWGDAEKHARDMPAPRTLAPTPGLSEDKSNALALSERFIEFYQANQLHVHRVNSAFEALRQSILDREVSAFWRRAKAGAGITPMPLEQLLSGHVNLLMRGYIWKHADKCANHVFVGAAELATRFPLAPKVDAPLGIEPSSLSKYLQLALHVHQLGFGPDSDDEKKIIMRELVKAAPQFSLTLSAVQVEYLATFLRNENVQLGKNRRQDRKRV